MFNCSFQLDDIISCKEVIEHFVNTKRMKLFQLLKKKWSVLKEMVYLLRIPYEATVSMKKQSLTLPDVLRIWLNIELHLKACCDQKKI